MRYILTRYILLLLTVNCFVAAQQDPRQETIDFLFHRGVELYNQKKYNEAAEAFDKIIKEYPINSKTTASKVFFGKTLLGQDKLDDASKVFNSFLKDHPASKYTDEAKLSLAIIHSKKGEYYSALSRLTELMEKPVQSFYSATAKSLGEQITLNYLNLQQVKQLYDSWSGNNAKSFLLLLLGKSYQREGDYINALRSYSSVLQLYPDSEEKIEAEKLHDSALKRSQDHKSSHTIVGVILPLNEDRTNTANSDAEEILEGIKFAFSEHNRGREEGKIGLLIRDTKNARNNIRGIKQEFENLPDLISVIGPLYSDECRIAIEEFKGTLLPLISPTATDDDLTLLDNHFFQANPSFGLRGRLMAQYLFFVEKKRNIAVLNAIDGYSPNLAHAFSQEFQRLGGKVIMRETYRSGDASINDAIIKLSPFAGMIDGLYLPLSDKNDGQVILTQMVHSNLVIPIYGNQDWFNVRGFDLSPQLSNNLVITSDYFIDFSSSEYQTLSREFRARTGKDLNRNCLYGYDAAKYLISAIDKSHSNRNSVKLKLESGFIFKGIKNDISVDESRINKFANIIRYKDGIFELIERFQLGN